MPRSAMTQLRPFTTMKTLAAAGVLALCGVVCAAGFGLSTAHAEGQELAKQSIQSAPVVPVEKPPVPETAEATPEPKRLVAEKKPPETNWSARCVTDNNGQTSACHVIQRIKRNKTGALLMSVLVELPVKTLKPELKLNLPLGLYLPAGTTLQVDKTPTKEIQIETCDVKGCYAGIGVDEDMLTALKRGNTMTVTFQNVARQPIAIPVTLVGFTAAFAKIR